MTGSNIKRFKNPLIYTTARTFADVTNLRNIGKTPGTPAQHRTGRHIEIE
jgi:hypothetical protein